MLKEGAYSAKERLRGHGQKKGKRGNATIYPATVYPTTVYPATVYPATVYPATVYHGP